MISSEQAVGTGSLRFGLQPSVEQKGWVFQRLLFFVVDILLLSKTEIVSSSSKYSDGCLASAISF